MSKKPINKWQKYSTACHPFITTMNYQNFLNFFPSPLRDRDVIYGSPHSQTSKLPQSNQFLDSQKEPAQITFPILSKCHRSHESLPFLCLVSIPGTFT